jgi:knotted carbamoyltransferase YgeW
MKITDQVRPHIERLKSLKTRLYQKDFLLTWKQSDADLEAVMLVAEALEDLYRANVNTQVFHGSLAVSNFRDKSTRTRFSYASAASLLGLSAMDLDESKSQIAHGETVRETANMISFLTETIGIRDDLFIGEGHRYMKEVSAALDDGYKNGVLPQRPGVINLQCDLDHPTQSLADLMHLKKTFGSLENLRGKKLAMTWAYSPSYGKPLSVAQGIAALMTRMGMDVALAHPEGYDIQPDVVKLSHKQAKKSGGSFTVTNNMQEAFKDADIVYPKSWAPFSVMEERTALLRAGRGQEVEALEKKCISINDSHKDWECTEEMMALTKGGDALYMHCLPADLTGISCEFGEVSKSVFERYRLRTYNEAEHKLYVIAAMMMMTRFSKPADVLTKILERNEPRRLMK